MDLERPDLSDVEDEVVAYIEALEMALLNQGEGDKEVAGRGEVEPSEPETTLQIMTMSQMGVVKRTARHWYGRQKRAGMGVYDLQVDEPDMPDLLVQADVEAEIILFSNLGRTFRVPVSVLSEGEVRDKGEVWPWPLAPLAGERVAAVLPANSDLPYVTLVSERGWVKRIRAEYVSAKMVQGNRFHDLKDGGEVAAVAWTGGDDIFIASRNGLGIRFPASRIPTRGCLGIRLDLDDRVVGVAGVNEDSGVFLISENGKGTIRLMSGFRQNQSPGAKGKVVIKTDRLVMAAEAEGRDDIFLISQTGKMIRFNADDIPAKTGVVQGVICMALRNDEVAAGLVIKG
ncbi:MAG TPA: DNA gyrase C-terminal beta-propeller domain-containing protein [Anaerolineae bacterium]|nr:DNA gyrase C-terminal beta-propeller domain-containing protein [Anaerolineae bacterium]